jgi:hypothetical protein
MFPNAWIGMAPMPGKPAITTAYAPATLNSIEDDYGFRERPRDISTMREMERVLREDREERQ